MNFYTSLPSGTKCALACMNCALAKYVLVVLAMYHSGIGGGGFAVVRTPEDKYEFIDFREMAPAAAFEDMYKDNVQGSITGGLARYCTYKHTSYS